MFAVKSANESTAEETALRSSHNYTKCCEENDVASQCMGFCAIHNILEGKTGIDPEACESHFPSIVKCMAGEMCFTCFNDCSSSFTVHQQLWKFCGNLVKLII